jgi:hypothetical protein
MASALGRVSGKERDNRLRILELISDSPRGAKDGGTLFDTGSAPWSGATKSEQASPSPVASMSSFIAGGGGALRRKGRIKDLLCVYGCVQGKKGRGWHKRHLLDIVPWESL